MGPDGKGSKCGHRPWGRLVGGVGEGEGGNRPRKGHDARPMFTAGMEDH